MKMRLAVVSVLFPACFSLISGNASGFESGVEGSTQRGNVFITSETAWHVLSSAQINIPGTDPKKTWHCVATASADCANPNVGADNRYLFTLAIDNTNLSLDGPCERTLEFDYTGNKDYDTTYKDVNSTCVFKHIKPGTHTIRWLGRKAARTPDAPDLNVMDNSLTVVCTDKLL